MLIKNSRVTIIRFFPFILSFRGYPLFRASKCKYTNTFISPVADTLFLLFIISFPVLATNPFSSFRGTHRYRKDVPSPFDYRTKLFWKFEMAAFIDAGNIWTFHKDERGLPGNQIHVYWDLADERASPRWRG